MNFNLLASLIFLIFVTGCAQNLTPTATQTFITEKPSTSTATSEATTSSPTAEIVITPTSQVNHSLDKCLTVDTDNPTVVVSQGYLLSDAYGDISNNKTRYTTYKTDMENKETIEISTPENLLFDVDVSPDRKLSAYDSYGQDAENLIIEDASGKIIKAISWKQEWGNLAGWLTNQSLLIGSTLENEQSSAIMSSTFIVFNPFTNEAQILKPNFPNIYENYSVAASWSSWRETVYNQELDRVVYLRTEPDGIEFSKLALWDIKRKQELANFDVFGDSHTTPRWAMDGSKFAFAASIKIQEQFPAYELRVVSRDGQVTQLTNLTEHYPWVYIDNFNWSPNGKHIAFWFSWWENEVPSWELTGKRFLAILDTDSNEIVNYCIQGMPSGLGIPAPIWSPNGKQLVVESPNEEGGSQVVLIDLESQIAVQIGKNMTPTGWMTKP